jgi:redox-sensitive bicupin YhaK (pirin superfamily)
MVTVRKAESVVYPLARGGGGYLYVVEGGGVLTAGERLRHLDAAVIVREPQLHIQAQEDAEPLFVVVGLK